MANILKNAVLQQLSQRGLTSIFNEADFNQYKRKYNKVGANSYYLALQIFDAFILNSQPVEPNELN